MRAAGFEDVVQEKFATHKQLGVLQRTNILEGLHGISISLFTKFLGMSTEEVEVFLADVRRDINDTRIHFHYPVKTPVEADDDDDLVILGPAPPTKKLDKGKEREVVTPNPKASSGIIATSTPSSKDVVTIESDTGPYTEGEPPVRSYERAEAETSLPQLISEVECYHIIIEKHCQVRADGGAQKPPHWS
ncbi:hypothetical protein PG994_008497 [Apiospora phragmitis]|uniref:Uncharacterized protein n=1 Tax=Apiospora phragmitis TaxID=2905665 RepID=A0ABR1UGM3_9PEZI